jgi:hypothetical protein
MLLVIFGAGASFDSVKHRPPASRKTGGQVMQNWLPLAVPTPVADYEVFRPPLANQLFDDRLNFVHVMQRYPACKPLVNLLRGQVQVEQQLARFEKEASTFPPRRRQLAAITYYIRDVISECQNSWHSQHRGITNYLTFLDVVERWRYETVDEVCIVTFNYDTMIEQSLTELYGWVFTGLSSYLSYDRYSLIKLHGSVDWGRELNTVHGNGTAGEIIDGAINSLAISDRFRMLRDFPHGFPALAIPIEKKSDFACPVEHIQALAVAIRKVTKIITIGWRATEQHFLDMLKKRLTGLTDDVDLMVVSGDDEGVRQTVSNLAIGPPDTKRKRALRTDGFTGLINQIGHLESFLRD